MDFVAGPVARQEQQQPKARRPHRPRKDYTNLDTVFDSLDHLKTALRQYMDNATTADALPQYVSCAMTLSGHAALPLKTPAEGPYAQGGANYVPFDGFDHELEVDGHGNDHHEQESRQQQQLAYKTVLELVNIDDLKQRQIWQRAAAKGIVHQIQHLDGFKYCFNNNWSSKDDNGYRYSYTCLDSLENKDRHANGFRATNAATRRPGANTRGVRKPTYDCKGQIAVKFSGVRQSVEVVYKHHAIHKTVAERRPPPRKDSKRKSVTLQSDPEPAADTSLVSFADPDPQDDSFILQDVEHTDFQAYHDPIDVPSAMKPVRKPKDSTQSRPKRQKTQPPQPVEQQERPLSLVEILQQSMSKPDARSSIHESPPQSSPPPLWQSSAPAPVPPPAPAPTPPFNLTGHEPTLVNRPSFGPSYQQPQPPDVGRFSKLAVPCFKCKAAQTQCDGRQPVCNSCQIRGTVCNYPSILRFDKAPISDSRWIQVQPTQHGRGVFRVNQTSSVPPAPTPQPNDIFVGTGQHMSWFPQG